MSGSGSHPESDSPRSSLKGWAASSLAPTVKSREDIDATRSSSSSYTSTRALHQPMSVPRSPGPGAAAGDVRDLRGAPMSSPNLSSSTGQGKTRLSEVPGAGSEKNEQQLKQERIWWSEQTLFEVQKMELALKQELQKTTSALREQFRRQLEIERNDSQQRSSTLEKSITRLREDFETFRDQQDSATALKRVAENMSQVEASLRMELDAVRCSLEDHHRQGSEQLSLTVERQRAVLDSERARLEIDTAGLREELQAVNLRLNRTEAQSKQHSVAAADAAALSAGASMDWVEACIDARMGAAVAEERSDRNRELDALRDETRRVTQELGEERLARVQASAVSRNPGASEAELRLQELERSLDNESDSRRSEVLALRSELAREHEARGIDVSEVREACRGDVRRIAQDLAREQQERTQADSNLGATLEALDGDIRTQKASRPAESGNASRLEELSEQLQHERRTWRTSMEELRTQMRDLLSDSMQKAASSGGDALNCTREFTQELTGLLEIECKARKSDVDELRQQLSLTDALVSERMTTDLVQGNLVEIDARVGGLVNALETERDARRSDGERHQSSLTDVMDVLEAERKLRTAEVGKLRGALADLALNLQEAAGCDDKSRGLSKALATLTSVLDEETMTSSRMREELSQAGLRGPGDRLLLELATSKAPEIQQAENGALRSDLSAALAQETTELVFKLRSLAAELREELSSRVEVVVATLRGDLAAQAAELRGDIAANRADLLQQIEDSVAEVAKIPSLGAGAGMGLQSSAAVAGQLSEVVRFMQVIANSTEHLGEKICTEGRDRRSSEAQVDLRISRMERRNAAMNSGEDLDWELEQRQLQEEEMLLQHQHQQEQDIAAAAESDLVESQIQQQQRRLQDQSLMNEGLKDSLEQLVNRVNRMLKPE
ncbi:unnamed protein product, partial [Polarella glacialis]